MNWEIGKGYEAFGERPRFVFLCPDEVVLDEHRRAAPGSAMMFASRRAMRMRGLTLPPERMQA